MQRKLALIVAAALGLLAVILTNVYLGQKEEAVRVQEVAVLVAAQDIVKGSVINYDMLTLQGTPVNLVQAGALRSKEQAVGKTVRSTIMAGEQVLAARLAAPQAGLTLAGKTPPGKRAFTLGLEAASAVGGMIRPGDHVDVLAIFAAPAFTVTLFQDILVLAVGQEMVPEEETGGREKQTITPTRRETVTVALSPQEVQIITVAIEQGKIRLTLRPQMETEKAIAAVDLSQLPPAVDLNTLLQYYIRGAKPVPSVEVIRGLKKEMAPLPPKKE